jgi:hypothetical protein
MLNLRVRRGRAESPTILLLHGLGATGDVWNGVIALPDGPARAHGWAPSEAASRRHDGLKTSGPMRAARGQAGQFRMMFRAGDMRTWRHAR